MSLRVRIMEGQCFWFETQQALPSYKKFCENLFDVIDFLGSAGLYIIAVTLLLSLVMSKFCTRHCLLLMNHVTVNNQSKER